MNTTFSPTADPKDFLRGIAFDLPGRFPIARWAPIPLRLIVGLGFIEHGLAKLSKGPDAFAAILHALAVPAPHFMAWVTNSDRAARRLSHTAGRLRFPGQFADDRGFIGSNFHCASALWIQLDQAHVRDSIWCAIWAGWV